MSNNERDFKGVWIPKEVWLDTRLNALEKCIFVEIDSLDSEDSGCYASNNYLANFCQCSEAKVSKAISKLIELGYIFTQSFNGRQRILRSKFTEKIQICLVKNTNLPSKKYKAGLEKIQDNNIIYNNNIINKINNNKERKKESATSYDEIISTFDFDDNVVSTIYEFIKMRKLIKKPMTDYALKRMLTKLSLIAQTPETQIQVLENSIINNWQDIYELKEGKSKIKQQRADYDSSSFDL